MPGWIKETVVKQVGQIVTSHSHVPQTTMKATLSDEPGINELMESLVINFRSHDINILSSPTPLAPFPL